MTNVNIDIDSLLADLVRLTMREPIAEDGNLQGWEPIAARRVTLIHKRVMREVYRRAPLVGGAEIDAAGEENIAH